MVASFKLKQYVHIYVTTVETMCSSIGQLVEIVTITCSFSENTVTPKSV